MVTQTQARRRRYADPSCRNLTSRAACTQDKSQSLSTAVITSSTRLTREAPSVSITTNCCPEDVVHQTESPWLGPTTTLRPTNNFVPSGQWDSRPLKSDSVVQSSRAQRRCGQETYLRAIHRSMCESRRKAGHRRTREDSPYPNPSRAICPSEIWCYSG